MMKLVQYKDIFPTSKTLYDSLKNRKPAEVFENKNWFTNSVDEIFQIIHSIFLAKTAEKYFVWNKEKASFQDLIDGFFLVSLWQELVNFYFHQLPFVQNNLKDLINWENRGNSKKTLNEGASNNNSNPTENGYKWDNEKDAASKKYINNQDLSNINRINDIKNMLANEITIKFNEIFFYFEKFFVSKNWADQKGLSA